MFCQLLQIAVVSYFSTKINCQCINTTIKNETSVQLTVSNLLEGSIDFSLNLLRVLNAEQKANKDSVGIFFSPHSVWSTLLIIYMGAQKTTEQKMKNILGLGTADKVVIWEAFRNMQTSDLFNKSSSESYKTANRIYFQEGAAFKECMKILLQSHIAFADFANKAEEARGAINTFVEKQTNNRIKDLIPADGISSLTRMVVANAVYFKESWQYQFDPHKTKCQRFTSPCGKKHLVNMMHIQGTFLYGTSEELQCYALELPYTGNNLSMVILLPENRCTGVDNLVQHLTPQRLKNLLNEMYPTVVSAGIPKFKIEDSFELSTALKELGLQILFNSREVDLSGFTGQKEFSVDSVHHKSFIDVNELGTEAAGATAAISSRKLGSNFNADYPFLYFIRDNHSNSILFLGVMKKPSETKCKSVSA